MANNLATVGGQSDSDIEGDFSSTDSDNDGSDSADGADSSKSSDLASTGSSNASQSSDADAAAGDTFDEFGTLGALVSADSELFHVNRDHIQKRGGGRRRGSVSAESTKDMMAAQQAVRCASAKKSPEQVARIERAISGNLLFANLDSVMKSTVIDSMFEQTFGPGKSAVIVQQGDTAADFFYIIDTGCCEVLVNDNLVATLKNGDSFGELALMYFAPRAATVRSNSLHVHFSAATDEG